METGNCNTNACIFRTILLEKKIILNFVNKYKYLDAINLIVYLNRALDIEQFVNGVKFINENFYWTEIGVITKTPC